MTRGVTKRDPGYSLPVPKAPLSSQSEQGTRTVNPVLCVNLHRTHTYDISDGAELESSVVGVHPQCY